MSSENDQSKYPNQGINPPYTNSEVRLAYYLYTWDQDGKSKQKTAWSTIGTYTLNSNNDIVYTANQNQLIKTNGSNGVAVVGNNFGVIVNNGSDVGPTILRLDGSYITGLDDLAHVDAYTDLHRKISTVDYHLLLSSSMNSFHLDYVNMWGSNENGMNSSSFYLTNSNSDFFPFMSYSAETVIEPVELAVIGKNSHGINAIENKGFIYNNIEYRRNMSIISYYTDMWNYFQDWQYGSNKLAISNYGEIGMDFVKGPAQTNSYVTQLSDFDVAVIRNFQNKFEQVYKNNSNNNIINNVDYKDNVKALSDTAIILSTIASTIDELMGNNLDSGSISTNTPLTQTLLNSALSALETWSSSKNLTNNLWEDQHTAIVMEKLPLNDTFMDFNVHSNATSIIGMNNRTKQWIELTLPVSDQSYERIMRNVITNADGDISSGSYSIGSVSQFINNYEIIYSSHGDIYSTASNVINIIRSYGNTGPDTIDSNTELFEVDSNYNFVWTSNTYFLQENNLNNSASTYRFIGIESTGGPYSNDQGSNSIKITGFNKILLDDLYENPNTYQDTTVTYYYVDGTPGSTENILEISGDLTSYSVQLTSAIKKDQNVLIGGCGSDGQLHTTGSPGVFYIPLPSDIDRDDDNAYVDTHWMLTTWTPNIANNAIERGINNNQNVLYKYTKMNDLITTGLYGGFTPYYNPGSGITAGLLRIPQISYGSNPAGKPVYVTSDENQMAKLSMIMYNNDGTVNFPNGNKTINLYNGTIELGDDDGTPIGNISPSINSENANTSNFFKYFDTYKQFAACVFTLNSNEKNIILKEAMMNNSPDVRNVAYLDLIGYADEEFDNLSFDVNRKYIFTFNAHVQVTNLNLMSDQINYGTPSLLLIGHFRNRYCKATIKEGGSNLIYPGRDIFIPLLNKPLENPVNNIYNIEGTYTLSWNTTGTSGGQFENVTKYEMYIPEEAKNYKTTEEVTELKDIWKELFKEENNLTGTIDAGDILHFENVLDRIYAFILTGETVNNNLVYQFVNNTTYQNEKVKVISGNDLDLITGKVVKNGTTFKTEGSESNGTVTLNITGTGTGAVNETIKCTLTDDNEFTNANGNITLTNYGGTTNVLAKVFNDGNTITFNFENLSDKTSELLGIQITATLVKGDDGAVTGVTVYDNHLSFDLNSTGIDSGILGVNEPMLSMTIQRY